ncbi:MAG: NTP transferase domain-containing protein [Acidimicrobiia bacterium]|nr:NTP transferase domain-containing protein [Acidimicrobiia bacterium]
MTRLVLPIRTFAGMTRLSAILGPEQRRKLAIKLGTRIVTAGRAAGLDVIVVTPDPGVGQWASDIGVRVAHDPGSGLDDACTATVASSTGPWIVAHADLPLVTAQSLTTVNSALDSQPVLAPSRDGGTNVVAGRGAFPFAYGPGSFARHLSLVPDAAVIVRPELAIDLDTEAEYRALTSSGVLVAAS